MKKSIRFTKKSIALLLTVVIVFGVLPIALLADTQSKPIIISETLEEESPILYEAEDLRGVNLKAFRRHDGSYTTVLSAMPLHYQKNGKWEDIDNTLREVTLNGEQVLQNTSAPFMVTLPKSITGSEEIRLEKDGYQISFYLNNPESSERKTTAFPETRAIDKENLTLAQEAAALEKKVSTISYKAIQKGIDLQYSITPAGLKEDIYIKNPQVDKVPYHFTICAPNLTGIMDEFQNITFVDENKIAIFTLPAPFMYDQKSNYSDSIKVVLESSEKDTYDLIYTPSWEWLADNAREYPVVIDPVINTNTGFEVEDTYVTAIGGGAYTTHYTLPSAFVEDDVDQTFIRFFNDTFFSSRLQIINASLTMYGINQANSNSIITAHKVTGAWEANTLTSQNKPTVEDYALDYAVADAVTVQPLRWDITKAVAEWMADIGKNYGIMLQISGQQQTGQVELYTTEAAVGYRPVFEISYRETSGKLTQYDYHSNYVGRAGTVYVNDTTRGIYVVRDELGITGNVMPVSITRHFCDANAYSLPPLGITHSPYGDRWLTNYNRLISYADNYADQVARYRYINAEGTVLYYIQSDQNPIDGNIKWVEETYRAIGDTGSILWVPQNLNSMEDYTSLKLENSEKQIETFDAMGRLSRITAQTLAASYIQVYYDGSSLIKIDKVVDGVGREYRFTYGTPTPSGEQLLTSIACYTANGTAITVGQSPLLMTYSYSNMGDALLSATYPDGESVFYVYNEQGLPTQVKDIDKFCMSYVYDDSGRVTRISEWFLDPSTNLCIVGEVLQISSQGVYQNTFISSLGETEVRRFDRYGRFVSTLDDTGRVDYWEYKNSDDPYLDSLLNNVRTVVVAQYGMIGKLNCFESENNLIINGDMGYATNSLPTGWTAFGLTVEDGIVMETLQGEIIPAIRLQGDNTGSKTLKQTVALLAKANDKVSLGGWAKTETAASLDISNGAKFQIKAAYTEAVTDEYGTITPYQKEVSLLFDPYAEGWQTVAQTINFEGDCSAIDIVIEYVNQENAACFTGICIIPTYLPTVEEILEEYLCVCTGNCAFGLGCPCTCENAANCECPTCLGDPGCDGTPNCSCSVCTEFCRCEGCFESGCPCRCANEVNCTCATCHRSTAETFDSYGNLTSYMESDGILKLLRANTYTPSGNYLASSTDVSGITTYYDYDKNTGLLTKKTDGEGNEIFYAYDAIGSLAAVTQALEGSNEERATYYDYENGRLRGITTGNGTAYSFLYDLGGRQSSIQVGNITLVDYDYSNENRIETLTFANGQTIQCRYDAFGNITGISTDGGTSFAYEYVYSDGQLVKCVDNLAEIVTLYSDTGLKLCFLEDENVVLYETSYDEAPNFVETVNGTAFIYSYNNTYDAVTGVSTRNTTLQSLLLEFDFNKFSIGMETQSDWFGRTLSKTRSILNAEDESLVTISSLHGYDDTLTTASTKINTFTSEIATPNGNYDESRAYEYTYDGNGNITEISLDSELFKRYTYDEAQQLIREDNIVLYQSITYGYDNHGNILEKNVYAFTTDDLSLETPEETIAYSYDDQNWPDVLTDHGDAEIFSDSMGNTIAAIDGEKESYYFWTAGRQLAHAIVPNWLGSGTCFLVSYTYDSNGLISTQTAREIIDMVAPNPQNIAALKDTWSLELFDCELSEDENATNLTIRYFWNGRQPVAMVMEDGGGVLTGEARPIYDGAGEIIGCIIYLAENDEVIATLYEKNLQGDVVALINPIDGSMFAAYDYDAWGNASIYLGSAYQGLNGIGAAVLSVLNPIRYRGYMTDVFTGLYYLETRFYNPQWGRFLNADDPEIPALTQGELFGGNLFAYCCNDPVNRTDPTGLWAKEHHESWTNTWLATYRKNSFLYDYRSSIAANNKKIDQDYPAWIPSPTNQRYHFNRDKKGTDSREQKLQEKVRLVGSSYKPVKANMDRSAEYIGQALHSVQDIVAHGQIGVDNPLFADHAVIPKIINIIPNQTKTGSWAYADEPKFKWKDNNKDWLIEEANSKNKTNAQTERYNDTWLLTDLALLDFYFAIPTEYRASFK